MKTERILRSALNAALPHINNPEALYLAHDALAAAHSPVDTQAANELRRLCCAVGLKDQIPPSDAALMECLAIVLKHITRQIQTHDRVTRFLLKKNPNWMDKEPDYKPLMFINPDDIREVGVCTHIQHSAKRSDRFPLGLYVSPADAHLLKVLN